MKSILDWLYLIPDEEIRKRALVNSKQKSLAELSFFASNFCKALSLAFIWKNSPEGERYWIDFHDKVMSCKIVLLLHPQKLPIGTRVKRSESYLKTFKSVSQKLHEVGKIKSNINPNIYQILFFPSQDIIDIHVINLQILGYPPDITENPCKEISIDSQIKTNKKEDGTVIVSTEIATISRGKVPKGSVCKGKVQRSAIAVGHLSNRVVS